MLTQLPPELVLSIISFLDLHSIHALSLVCKTWKYFINQNESTVYHAVSVRQGYIASTAVDFNQLSSLYSPKSLDGVNSWKSLCQRRVHIDKSWTGKASSRYVSYRSFESAVHRIKVDEKAGFIITSFRDGGLAVTDFQTNEMLWSLPKSYVKRYAHVEYDHGFLIFDRLRGSKEVWRLASDFSESESLEADHDQISASESAFDIHSDTYPRGHFKPWALLKMPRPTHAFRFVYPSLLVCAWDHAYLWDIPSSRLVQTITSIQEPEDPASAFALVLANSPVYDAPPPRLATLNEINYVEVDSKHVFICGVTALRVFSRATGKCILDVPSARQEFGSRKLMVLYESDPMTQGSVLVNQHIEMEEFEFPSSTYLPRVVDEFLAVHVSSSGRHLVAMLASSRVIIIKDFQDSMTSLFNRMIQIQLGSCRSRSKYLALHEDRVAVATHNGLFIFSLSAVLSASTDLTNTSSSIPSDPNPLRISRAPYFSYSVYTSNITCLQLSDTGLYLNWDPAYLAYFRESVNEQARLDEIWRKSASERRHRYLRMPNGDWIVILDDENFLTEISLVCGIDFTPALPEASLSSPVLN